MRSAILSSTLAGLCGMSLVALGGCGSDGGDSSTSDGPTTPTVTPISASGTWVGSYTAVTGVASHRAIFDTSMMLGVIGLPAGGLAPADAPATRTVTFTISFIQTNGSLIGTYIDMDGNHGTVTGTIDGEDADIIITFFGGASGTLHMTGTFGAGAAATEAGSFTGTVTESYTPEGGVLLNANGTATLGDRLVPETPDEDQTPDNPATDFTGWWVNSQTGQKDQDHEGEGTQLLVMKTGGVWKLYNPFVNETAPAAGATFTEDGSTLVLTWRNEDFGDGNEQSLMWNKEVWSIIGSGAAIQAVHYDGGTAATAVWSGTSSYTYAYDRMAGPMAPTLTPTAKVLAHDMDSASVDVSGANAQSVDATYDGTTVQFRFPLAGAPNQGVVYDFKLWDQVSDTDESTAPLVTAQYRWNEGSSSWGGAVQQQIGNGSGTVIASGASITADGNAIVLSITKEAWAAATGRTPTGGSIKAWFHGPANDNATFWSTMKDMTPFAYFKLTRDIVSVTDPVGDVTIPASADLVGLELRSEGDLIVGHIDFAAAVPDPLVPGKWDDRISLFVTTAMTGSDYPKEFMLWPGQSVVHAHEGDAADYTVNGASLTWSGSSLDFSIPRSEFPNAGRMAIGVHYHQSDLDTTDPDHPVDGFPVFAYSLP